MRLRLVPKDANDYFYLFSLQSFVIYIRRERALTAERADFVLVVISSPVNRATTNRENTQKQC